MSPFELVPCTYNRAVSIPSILSQSEYKQHVRYQSKVQGTSGQRTEAALLHKPLVLLVVQGSPFSFLSLRSNDPGAWAGANGCPTYPLIPTRKAPMPVQVVSQQPRTPTAQPEGLAEHISKPLYLRIFTVWSKIYDRNILSLADFLDPPDTHGHFNYQQLVQIVGDAHYDRSDFGRWIFEQAAELLTEVRPTSSLADNNEWSHAASHLFRGSAFHPKPHRSLLDHPEARPRAENLLSRAVEFCEHSGSLGTTAVSLRGVIASNLQEWVRTGDITSFYFHPACLQSPQFRELLKEASDHEARDAGQTRAVPAFSTARATSEKFCLSQTPAEFLEWHCRAKEACPFATLRTVWKPSSAHALPQQSIIHRFHRFHRFRRTTLLPAPPRFAFLGLASLSMCLAR